MRRHLGVCGFLLACVLLGCGSGSTTKSVTATVTQAKDPGPAVKDLPVVAVTDGELSKEWKADRGTVEKKYAGKRVEVSGTVWMVSNNNATGFPMVMLEGDMNPKEPTSIYSQGIQCTFPEADANKIAELGKGQKMKVRAVLGKQYGACIGLPDCELVETGPSTVIKATVDQLVADYKADREEARKKYDEKSIRVEAPVGDLKWEDDKRVTFTLEGKAGAKLDVLCECDINEKLRPALKAVKKGDTVKIQGQGQPSPGLDHGELLK